MEPERWQQIGRMYHDALARDESQRASFLAEACATDELLRVEVASLLALEESTGKLLGIPAMEVAAQGLLVGSHVFTAGRRIGSYTILSRLGAGGMGEVYRARDMKLRREVAIKILPPVFTRDPDRLARFEREARMLASLNHPHIGAIYGLEDIEGTPALVLELVEGVTLAERIATGPLPLVDALAMATQIAEALEAAHDKGIIHRDLKPANIKITPEGVVKVLDFGLAKAAAGDQVGPNLTHSPIGTSMGGTREGTILGTAAYMSPEQARGKTVDRRADVWAFGCVLYEMLTARQTFPNGETLSDTLAGVLTREPDWQAVPDSTPPRIRVLLENCLRKDERRRLRDIGYARIEIGEAGSDQAAPAQQPTVPDPWRRRTFVLGVTLASVCALAAAGVFLSLAPSPVPGANAPSVRFDVFAPDGATFSGLSQLSPDGLTLAFVATSASTQRIWVRPLGASAARPLPSTEGTGPSLFWSADSRYIGFFAGGKLLKVASSGGPSQFVCDLPAGRAYFGSWNAEGVIILKAVQDPSSALLRVSAAGGQPAPLTELDASRKETFHGMPSFLPDGRHYFFLTGSSEHGLAAFVGTLDSKERHPLPGIASAPQYSPSGHVLFVRGGVLMAQSFDANRLELSGRAFPVAEVSAPLTPLSAALLPGDPLAALFFSVSMNGALAYRPGQPAAEPENTQLAWYDRTGHQLSIAGPAAGYRNPALSPDGRYVAFERGNPAAIWVLDIQRGLSSPFTSHAAADIFPIWSPDGRTIVFASDRDGTRSLYERAYGVAGEEKQLLKAAAAATDWSRVGTPYISLDLNQHIWALPLSRDSRHLEPLLVTESAFSERSGRISPDGHWIAYVSTDQSPGQLYVQSFPHPGPRQQVSTKGAITPRWSHDGKELFYLAPDSNLMAVSITSTGSSLVVGVPEPLFKPRILIGAGLTRNYDVAGDGRFLINITNPTSTNSASAPISVILNWPESVDKPR